jgi:hypothetical protein
MRGVLNLKWATGTPLQHVLVLAGAQRVHAPGTQTGCLQACRSCRLAEPHVLRAESSGGSVARSTPAVCCLATVRDQHCRANVPLPHAYLFRLSMTVCGFQHTAQL